MTQLTDVINKFEQVSYLTTGDRLLMLWNRLDADEQAEVVACLVDAITTGAGTLIYRQGRLTTLQGAYSHELRGSDDQDFSFGS